MKTQGYLSKGSVLRMFAVCRQGERSIDAVLHPSQTNWAELRRYYTAEKRQVIRSALADLALEPSPVLTSFSEAVAYRHPSCFASFLEFVVNKWRRTWRFGSDEQRFLANNLGRLLSVLESDQQPAHTDLVQLRLNLTAATSFLWSKLSGIRELSMIYDVEYFAPPAGKRLHSLHELLGDYAGNASSQARRRVNNTLQVRN